VRALQRAGIFVVFLVVAVTLGAASYLDRPPLLNNLLCMQVPVGQCD
jgi:hypothetical protein